MLALTEQVTYRLRQYNLNANSVCVQLRTNKFEDFSHSGKLEYSTSNTKEIYKKVKLLLDEMYKDSSMLRLIGVRVDNLSSKEEEQLSLFVNETNNKNERLDKTIDELNDKYGYNSITRAGKMNANAILKSK
ncbi:DNA polymerase IV [compost metagenome]